MSEKQQLVIEYDYIAEGGSVFWTSVTFSHVIAFHFNQEACCTSDDLIAYNQMISYSSSPWLNEIRQRWRSYFVGQEQQQNEDQRFTHYVIYFNDVGCISVVAQSFDIRVRCTSG
jgi:hypothetical protein